MATTIEDLRMSVGLDLSQLSADFIAADQTVNQGLARLNREKNNIQLKAELDMARLNAAGDATKALAVQEAALSQQLALQRDRVQILSAAYQESASSKGKEASATQRILGNLLKEQIEVEKLTAALKNLQAQQNVPAPRQNTLLAGYQGMTGKLASAQAAISQFTSSTDNAIISSLQILEMVPGGWGKAAAAATAAAATITVAGYSLTNMAKPAIEAGNNTYKLAQYMGITTAEAASFNRIFSLAGVSADVAAKALMRLDKQVMSAGKNGNEATKMLERFGVNLKNSRGQILPQNQQLERLAEGFERAAAAGEREEFVVATLGARGRELIPVLMEYKELREDAAKVKTTGLVDPEQAHQAAREMRIMNAELGQMKLALSAALIPVARELMPEYINMFKSGVDWIAQNKEGIKGLAQAIADATSKVTRLIGLLAEAGAAIGELYKTDSLSSNVKDALAAKNQGSAARMYQDLIDANAATNDADIRRMNEWLGGAIRDKYGIDQQALDAEQKRSAAAASAEDVRRQENRKATDEIIGNYRRVSEQAEQTEESRKRAAAIMAEVEKINYHASHGFDESDAEISLKNRLYDIEADKQAAIKAAQEKEASEEELKAITLKAEAEKRAARQESARASHQAAQALNAETETINFSMQHSSGSVTDEYAKQLHAIDAWKAAQLQKARGAEETAAIVANAAAKEAQAYMSAAEKVKNATENMQDKLYKLTHSDKENQAYDLYKEAIQALKQGVDKNLVQQYVNAYSKKNGLSLPSGSSSDNGIEIIRGRNRGGGGGDNPYYRQYLDAMKGNMQSLQQRENEQLSQHMTTAAQTIGNSGEAMNQAAQTIYSAGTMMNDAAQTVANTSSANAQAYNAAEQPQQPPNMIIEGPNVTINNPVTVTEESIRQQTERGISDAMDKVRSRVQSAMSFSY